MTLASMRCPHLREWRRSAKLRQKGAVELGLGQIGAAQIAILRLASANQPYASRSHRSARTRLAPRRPSPLEHASISSLVICDILFQARKPVLRQYGKCAPEKQSQTYSSTEPKRCEHICSHPLGCTDSLRGNLPARFYTPQSLQ